MNLSVLSLLQPLKLSVCFDVFSYLSVFFDRFFYRFLSSLSVFLNFWSFFPFIWLLISLTFSLSLLLFLLFYYLEYLFLSLQLYLLNNKKNIVDVTWGYSDLFWPTNTCFNEKWHKILSFHVCNVSTFGYSFSTFKCIK